MRRREFIAGFGGAAAWPLVVRAQQSRLPTVGLLNGVSFAGPYAAPVAAIREGLQEAGFVEGQSLSIEYRTADGEYERLPELAADLVRSRAAVIIAIGASTPAMAATASVSTIPIVFATGSDTVGVGRRPA
jgi:putative tryptophan/tyrosine transport system substrate-binding protein